MSQVSRKHDKNLRGILYGQTKSSIPSKTAGAPKMYNRTAGAPTYCGGARTASSTVSYPGNI